MSKFTLVLIGYFIACNLVFRWILEPEDYKIQANRAEKIDDYIYRSRETYEKVMSSYGDMDERYKTLRKSYAELNNALKHLQDQAKYLTGYASVIPQLSEALSDHCNVVNNAIVSSLHVSLKADHEEVIVEEPHTNLSAKEDNLPPDKF